MSFLYFEISGSLMPQCDWEPVSSVSSTPLAPDQFPMVKFPALPSHPQDPCFLLKSDGALLRRPNLSQPKGLGSALS